MADEVVGSFPYREWAHEIQNALNGKGIAAEVAYAGPRAYPVYVAGKDYKRAGEVLEQVGYFSCPVSSGRAGLGSILDWLPQEALDEEELYDQVKKVMEYSVVELAEQYAAETWSLFRDDPNELWVIATFGDSVAVNGDLWNKVGPCPQAPAGFLETRLGGSVPSSEAEVSRDAVFRATKMKFEAVPDFIIDPILKRVWQETYGGGREVTYTSVSGESQIYRKRDKGNEE